MKTSLSRSINTANMTTPQDFFDKLHFPVFSADENGHISYKNRAAVRYIGTLRKGSGVLRHFWEDVIPPAGKVVHIKGAEPYFRALVLTEASHTYFLCLPRLQYPDFETAAKDISRIFGTAPSVFLQILTEGSEALSRPQATPLRLGTECFNVYPKDIPSDHAPYLLESITKKLFLKAENTFGALGYRIQTEILPEFLENHPIFLNRWDLASLIGCLLYLFMKMSDDGRIRVSLSSNSAQDTHLIRFFTHTSRFSQKECSATEAFAEYIPEYTSEIILMEKQNLIPEDARFFKNERDELVFEYPIPYLRSVFKVCNPSDEYDYSFIFTALLLRTHDMLEKT